VSLARRTVLAVLLSVVPLAAAPAAWAATAHPIAWSTYSTTLAPSSTVSVCADGTALRRGQAVLLQTLRSGRWVTAKTVTITSQYQRCLDVRPATLVAKPGTYHFRAATRFPSAASLSEARITLTLQADPYSSAYAYTTEDKYLTSSTNRVATVSLSSATGQRVELQRKDGGVWRTVASRTAPHAAYGTTVGIPIPAKVGLATYRAVSRATAWTRQSISSTFDVHQTDAARYGGYIATARQVISRFCPKTPIFVDTPSVRTGNTIGYASGWWQGGGPGGGSLHTSIELRSGLTGTELRHTAMHECAHVVQYRTVVEGRYDAEQSNAWRLYPEVGDEGQADCMAYQVVRARQPLYYVDGCTSTQLADAQRMWLTYGSKYQAAVFTWT
jgi:hypothetical protein